MSNRDHAGAWLLSIYAVHWPLEVYGYVPYTGLYLGDLIALALLVLYAIDIISKRTAHVPFSILWPTGTLTVTAVFLYTTEGTSALKPIAVAVFFIAATHGMHSRALIERLVLLSALGVAGACLVNLVGFTLEVFPTAWSTESNARFYHGGNLRDAVLTLVVGGVFATMAVPRPRSRLGATLRLTCAAVIFLTVLTSLSQFFEPLNETTTVPWSPTHFTANGLPGMLAWALALWLVARAMANAWVARDKEHPRLAAGLVVAAAMAFVIVLSAGAPLAAHHGFLLALLTGAARAREEQSSVLISGWVGVAATIGLVAMNLMHVFPDNTRDPRNYGAHAQAIIEGHDYDTLYRYLERVRELAPGERYNRFLWAKALLEIKQYEKAAREFAIAVAPHDDGESVILRPDEREIDAFLEDMRNACSALPLRDTQLAYEIALCAAGKAELALSSIEHRVSPVPYSVPPEYGPPFAYMAANMLGASELEEQLATLSPEVLTQLLLDMGADVKSSDVPFVELHSPVVLGLVRTPKGSALFYTDSARREEFYYANFPQFAALSHDVPSRMFCKTTAVENNPAALEVYLETWTLANLQNSAVVRRFGNKMYTDELVHVPVRIRNFLLAGHNAHVAILVPNGNTLLKISRGHSTRENLSTK